MKKPIASVEWLKRVHGSDQELSGALIDYLDSIPDDAHICKWPKRWTKERILEAKIRLGKATILPTISYQDVAAALMDLAAIAPEAPKKRMVNLWRNVNKVEREIIAVDADKLPACIDDRDYWCQVAGPIEIEE